jgi:hypothetical protein
MMNYGFTPVPTNVSKPKPLEKDECPTQGCGRKAITTRRVYSEKHYICGNGHNWPMEPREEKFDVK